MTALINERARRQETWKTHELTLASGTKAFKGGRAALNGSGKVVPASAAIALVMVGLFAETVDATAADKPVTVDFETELQIEWFANAGGGDAVLATDVGGICYQLDDQTVTITPDGKSVAGRVWAVDAVKGVAVEKLEQAERLLPVAGDGAFVANDWVIASVEPDAIYDIPATAAASTVTLPAAAPDGTRATFVADGTKNGHTVQYRDATGPANLTTALTASKRHTVVAIKRDGNWYANAYISP